MLEERACLVLGAGIFPGCQAVTENHLGETCLFWALCPHRLREGRGGGIQGEELVGAWDLGQGLGKGGAVLRSSVAGGAGGGAAPPGSAPPPHSTQTLPGSRAAQSPRPGSHVRGLCHAGLIGRPKNQVPRHSCHRLYRVLVPPPLGVPVPGWF